MKDECTYALGEDLALSLEVQRRGWKVTNVCTARIFHDNQPGSHTSSQPEVIAMQYCDHHIIVNSTFSWWASWLDDKPNRRVIAPRTWSPLSTRFIMRTEDLLPEDWQTIS